MTSKKYGIISTIIDTDDLEKCKTIHWFPKYDETVNNYYVRGSLPISNKEIPLHRFLTKCPKGLVIDHKNNNTLDNRKDNLRICTNALNSQNRNGANSSNKSCGLRNVTWNKNVKKWQVSLVLNGKRMHFGFFKDLEEANKIAKEARKEHFKFNEEDYGY